MTPYEMLTDIHALEGELLSFERKYGIRSETFYAAYASGEEPEDDAWVLDFGEWASVYRTWLERQVAYRDAIQRLQQQKHGSGSSTIAFPACSTGMVTKSGATTRSCIGTIPSPIRTTPNCKAHTRTTSMFRPI